MKIIEYKDIVISTHRTQNQPINSAESAVRATDIETGIYAECDMFRSKLRNEQIAIDYLQVKLNEHYYALAIISYVREKMELISDVSIFEMFKNSDKYIHPNENTIIKRK